MRRCNKGFQVIVLKNPKKGMFAFEIFGKSSVSLFIRKQYLAVFSYFHKIDFTLTRH